MKRSDSIRLFTLGVLLFLTVRASATSITGTVFNDQSGDGNQNPGEPGIPKIAVSNGHDIVLTDVSGNFKIEAVENSFIFVIKPSGWKIPLDFTNRPQFYRKISTESDLKNPLSFPLVPETESDDFQVLVTADPQVSSEQEIGFYERSIVEPFSKKRGPAFGVALGDIVSDHFELYEKMAEASGKIGIPFYNLNGNHDFDFSGPSEKGLSRYHDVFGPGTYAFEYAHSLFIALDDIRPKKESGYIGGFTEEQFQFLKNILSVTKPEKRIILMMHIPLFQNGAFGAETFRQGDRDRLFKMLESRKHVLVLSGHTHAQCHVFYGLKDGWNGSEPLHEYNVAAACGSFWNGRPDKDGIPVATMWDGTPPGCGLVTFGKNENVQCDYIPSRLDPSFQIGLHAPASARTGEAWVSFYANVFNGHEGWRVEYSIGGQPWQVMRRVPGSDPAYFQSFLEQNSANPPLPWRRLPDPVECRHLWRAYLPTGLSPGKQTLEVRATEPSGKQYSVRKEINLTDK